MISVLGSVALVLGAMPAAVAAPRATAWITERGIESWSGAPVTPGRRDAITYEKSIRAPIEFDDLVVSWDARARDGAWFEIQVQASYGERSTKWYTIAHWSEGDANRMSVAGQKDADGDVLTDTWVLTKPTRTFRVRVVNHVGNGDGFASIQRLDFSFVNSGAPRPTRPENRRAWGVTLPVSKLCQGHYASGNVLCSPTSLSMLINYWAGQLNQPFMKVDVPESQSGVFDPTWGGTGNWSFNTAYAATRGLRSYVTRLNNLTELETWIHAGFPVSTSVSYDLLKGKGVRSENDGHLVVLVGFTEAGDPIFNDPGRSDQERHIYRRDHFDAAWASSGRAAYIVFPHDRKVPKSRNAPWGQ